jgi:ketosteroid isomerase-like protein
MIGRMSAVLMNTLDSYRRFVALAPLLICAAGADGATVSDLAWLAGCWADESGDAGSGEQWSAPAGGTMLGIGRMVRGERTVAYEYLQIRETDAGALSYVATPSGQAEVAFELTRLATAEAVFENAAHDYPQSISYRLEGDQLTAEVGGERGGQRDERAIRMRRVDCGATSSGDPADLAALEQQVRNVERAFAQTMADRDHEAFETFLSSDAVFFSTEPPLRGKDDVADWWRRYFEPGEAPFSWAPEHVAVLESRDLALSTGPVRDPSGMPIATFMSIWRQEAPGIWRIVFDIGSPRCDCSAERAP